MPLPPPCWSDDEGRVTLPLPPFGCEVRLGGVPQALAEGERLDWDPDSPPEHAVVLRAPR